MAIINLFNFGNKDEDELKTEDEKLTWPYKIQESETKKYKELKARAQQLTSGSTNSSQGTASIVGTSSSSTAGAWQAGGEPIPMYCEGCGKEMEQNAHIFGNNSAMWSFNVVDGNMILCKDCKNALESHLRDFFAKDSDVHCQNCKKHIKACTCPDKEKLNKLKK